jgi:hypothetical protein
VALAPTATAGPYDGLLQPLPADTNTLLLVDAKAAFASPLARGEKWADDSFQRYRSGLGLVPPETEAVVVASSVNLSSMTRANQLALLRARNAPTAKDLAAREGGTIDDLGGQLVVLSPRNAYLCNLPGSSIAVLYPADRQVMARWLQTSKAAKGPSLSPYLTAAAGSDATVVIAVDLADSLDPGLLRARLPFSPAVVRQRGVDVRLVAGFLASVRGLTFTAKVTDRIVGTIRIDFGSAVGLYQRITKELFLEVLDEEGIAIPGMAAWETTFEEKAVTLSGSMTTADLRRVLSLFAFPDPAAEDDPKQTPNQVSVPATQRYLGAASVVLGDLRKTKDSPDYVKTATWHEKAADQLEHLGRKAVDPVAAEATFECARRLRAIAASLRGVPIDLDALSKQAYYRTSPNYGVGLNWRGFGGLVVGPNHVDTNYAKIREAQAKVIADDQQRRVDVWSQIDQIQTEARRKLGDKYKVPF